MPKSPGENSSGEAVTGGRERGSSERYYCSQETGKLGRGKGRRRESEARKYSVAAQGAVSSEQDSHLPGYTRRWGIVQGCRAGVRNNP